MKMFLLHNLHHQIKFKFIYIICSIGLSVLIITLAYFNTINFTWITDIFDQDSKIEKNFNIAKELYFTGKFQQSLFYVNKYQNNFYQLDEGCELIISVYAQTNQLSHLETSAKHCIENNLEIAISSEALAMIASKNNLFHSTIHYITSHTTYTKNPRILATLSMLYAYDNKSALAHKSLLQAIDLGKSWRLWLERVFSHHVFYDDSEFLIKLVTLIAKKDQIAHDQYQRLAKLLTEKNLSASLKILETTQHKNINSYFSKPKGD